ncbi:MAG: type II secretion system F family protein [Erysipelotrichia bacterium]|nr:type II secretion system F family protein [Erysipelotrichia bacterium]
MPRYVVEGVDSRGQPVFEEVSGSSESEVLGRLMSAGISVLSIKPKGLAFSPFKFLERFSWVSAKDLKLFYVNLATLIEAGCTLITSLSSLADQAENPTFRKVLLDVSNSVTNGRSFGEALQAHPRVFNQLFICLVKAGEEGGMLDKILLRYAIFSENQEGIKSRVRGAMVLPAIMVLVATGVIIGLLTYVFPTFMVLFKGRESMLPLPTKIVLAISDFLRYQYLTLSGIIIGVSIAFYFFVKSKRGWRIFCYWQLRLPLIGTLFKKAYVASFAHTLGALIKGGVPALRALKITAETIQNIEVSDVIGDIAQSVERGGTFSAPMQRHKYLFPTMVTLMVNVGESTGRIDQMLEKVGQYYDGEVQEAISAILTAIEPLMTVVMGVIVMTIAASMFLPMFDIARIMQ